MGILICGSDTSCHSNLLLQVDLTGVSGSDWGISVQLDPTTLKDNLGNNWTLSEPIFLSFQLTDFRVEYRLQSLATVYNAYEDQVLAISQLYCPQGKICCPSTRTGYQFQRSFMHNATAFNLLQIASAPRSSYAVAITASQDAASTSLSLSPSSPSAANAIMEAYIAAEVILPENYVEYVASYIVQDTSHDPSAASPSAFFLVDPLAFEDAPNKIGVSQPQWNAATSCTSPVGAAIAVDSGLPWDQFSSFRADSMDGRNPCDILPDRSTPLLRAYACPRFGSLILSLRLSVASFNIFPLFGAPLLIANGTDPIDPQLGRAVRWFVLQNVGNESASFQLQATRCCYADGQNNVDTTQCQITLPAAASQFLAVNQSARMQLSFILGEVLDRPAVCQAVIVQHGRSDLAFAFSISFAQPTRSSPSSSSTAPDFSTTIFNSSLSSSTGAQSTAAGSTALSSMTNSAMTTKTAAASTTSTAELNCTGHSGSFVDAYGIAQCYDTVPPAEQTPLLLLMVLFLLILAVLMFFPFGRRILRCLCFPCRLLCRKSKKARIDAAAIRAQQHQIDWLLHHAASPQPPSASALLPVHDLHPRSDTRHCLVAEIPNPYLSSPSSSSSSSSAQMTESPHTIRVMKHIVSHDQPLFSRGAKKSRVTDLKNLTF